MEYQFDMVENCVSNYMSESKSIYEQIHTLFSEPTVDVRGENAWGVAVKFLRLLEQQIEEEEERKKLMGAWMRSVRDNDYKKFQRALKKYRRQRDGLPDEEN
jgi:hypothetical protein